MEKENQLREATDLGTFIGEIARKITLRGEMLRGVSNLWFEGEHDELPEITAELGVELGRLGRKLKLVRDCLCNNCQMKSVQEIVSMGEATKGQPERD